MIPALLLLSLARQPSSPDLILHNGRIITVDRDFRIAEAAAIAGGRFIAVGESRDILKAAGPETAVIDLDGKAVVPGLGDNHLHSAGGGPGVDLSRARSLAELLEAIVGKVRQSAPGELIITNSDWHEAQLREQRLPYRQDLDRVAPDNPVVVVRGGHEYILNSAALNKWNITRDTPVPAGGHIGRDEQGELNGELVDRAKDLAVLPRPAPLSLEQRLDALAAEHLQLNAAGLTSIRYPGALLEHYEALRELEVRGRLTVRVNHLFRLDATLPAEKIREEVSRFRVVPGEGNDWLRVGGVKLGVDGGFEGGLMRQPYREPWGKGGSYRGIQTVPTDRFREAVQELNRLGQRVATHAVGDAAIDLVLDAYEAADREKSIVGRRWSIEHGFIPRPEQFPRMKKLDLAISAQHHLYLAGPSLVKYWGAERAQWVTPVRAYLDAGLHVSAGSDSPVLPFAPLPVIYHFVTRDTLTGGVMGADQRINRKEALSLATREYAHLTFEEDGKGSIEPGKLADLVVLSKDPLTAPEQDLRSIEVLLTVVGGKVVYRRPDFELR